MDAQLRTGAELNLKKELNAKSSIKMQEFKVDKELSSLFISITGNVTSGKLRISLFPPQGNPREFEIDENTNLDFKETFNLKKSPENTGNWKIHIESDLAKGSYHLIMRTSPI
jgi:hypothetical protein